MRKFSIPSFIFFFLSIIFVGLCSFWTVFYISHVMDFKQLRALFLIIFFIILFYSISVVLFRIYFVIMPVKEGYIIEGSRQEFYYNIYLLFRLILFFPIIRTKFLPVPLKRPLYITPAIKYINQAA